jgi:hypothetical protein
MAKTIVEAIIEVFPELQGKQLHEHGIWLQNDSDGTGDYIAKWEFSEPIHDSLKSYLRS